MPTAAYHTLGCKVNQYDTQAMEELLSSAGWKTVPFPSDADVYLVNTCTVTGTGDKKSLQTIRRLRREHPQSKLIVCGCLAQLRGAELLDTGADLILGTQFRNEVVQLLSRVIEEGKPICAVRPLESGLPFEPLRISRQEGHTRAVLKIQEGCANRCSYCVIPLVRGPIRSRPLPDILEESRRLADAGFREIVLTGIHLSSYGRDLDSGISLADVISGLQAADGILRIRLGSLEPTIVTRDFMAAVQDAGKLCPQFHLALQSGSDSVLRRMRRRYNTSQYLKAVDLIREFLPDAALTTDILTGFPGETEAEFLETAEMIRRVGFARIHVFPYSPRPHTDAAVMPGQLPDALRQERARKLIAIGEETALAYRNTWLNRETELLPEEIVDGCWEGYTPEYIRVKLNPDVRCCAGMPVRIRISSVDHPTAVGEISE
jgi:threonylcarbamoyladenosine tRNA methylthiotransferase MtaB